MPDDPTDLPSSVELTKDSTKHLTVHEEMASGLALKELKERIKAYNETVKRSPFPFPEYVKSTVDLLDASRSLPPNIVLTPPGAELRATLLTNMAAALKPDGDGQQVLKQLLGTGSPCGKAHPEKVQAICTSLGNHGGDDSVAKRETTRFQAEQNHLGPLNQIIAGVDNGTMPFNAKNAAQASIQALEAGALSANGDLVVGMTRLSGRRRPGDNRPSIPDVDREAWIGEVLGSDAFANAAKAYPHPDVLRQMKHMISLCQDPGVKVAATGKFDVIAASLGQSDMLTNGQKQTVQRLQTEVHLRPEVPIDFARQLHVANQILQTSNKDLVDSHVGALLRMGNHDAIDLAGQIVQSGEFLNAFGADETAEAVVNVAEAQLLQESEFGAGKIKTNRLLQAGMHLLPQAGKAENTTDVTPALRVAVLLAKRQDEEGLKAAEQLLDHVFSVQSEVFGKAVSLQPSVPHRQKGNVDEFQMGGPDDTDTVDAPAPINKADALQAMAQISRAYAVYFPDKAASHANVISEAAKEQFRQALDNRCWDQLAGLGEVADQLEWISARDPKLVKGDLLTREQMINTNMTRAEGLWKDVANPEKKVDLTDPINHDFMDALQCGLALASHDRELCKLPLERAKELQKNVAKKQGEPLGVLNQKLIQNSISSPDLEQEIRNRLGRLDLDELSTEQKECAKIQCEVHARLEAAGLLDNTAEGLTYRALRDMGQEIDLAVEIASETAAELEAIGSHGIKGRKVADLREDVKRFTGELKTGLEYSRAFAYTSGSDMSEDDEAIASDFAKQASFAVSEATLELMTNDISHWDLGTTRMQNHINRQQDWETAGKMLKVDWKGSDADLLTARKALTNDMRLLKKYSEKLPTDKEKKNPHRKLLAELIDECNDNVDEAIQKRAQQIKHNPKDQRVSDAAKSLGGTFAKEAGYLVEERAYQLLQDQQRTGWDAQNTTVIPSDSNGKNTRPDLMQRLGGDKWVALDFTASNSSGHIFGKANAWVSDKVTQVVEITYPSFEPDELERFMLEKAAIPPGAVAAAKQAAEDRQKQIQQTAKDAKHEVQKLYLDLRALGGTTQLLKDLKKEGFNPNALVKWAGMGGTTKYGHESIKGTFEVNSARTLKDLEKLTKSIQALKKIAEGRGIPVPPKVEQMARDGIQSYRVPPPPRAPAPVLQPVVNAPPVLNQLPAVSVSPGGNVLPAANGHPSGPLPAPGNSVKERINKRKLSALDTQTVNDPEVKELAQANKKIGVSGSNGGSKPKVVNLRSSK